MMLLNSASRNVSCLDIYRNVSLEADLALVEYKIYTLDTVS